MKKFIAVMMKRSIAELKRGLTLLTIHGFLKLWNWREDGGLIFKTWWKRDTTWYQGFTYCLEAAILNNGVRGLENLFTGKWKATGQNKLSLLQFA